MELKKLTALFFIMLAGSIFFAHAVIPHHQHQSKICVVGSTSELGTKTHESHTSNHKHNNNTNSQCCALLQVYFLASNQIKQELQPFEDTSNQNGIDVFQAIIADKISISLIITELFSNSPSIISSAYALFVKGVVGLRAPPSI